MTRSARQLSPHPASADPRWTSVVARDARADGAFVYSVRTTGVYCRPSCPSRQANPANVSFHTTPQDARAAGYRPCRRCRPDEPAGAEQARRVAEACRTIEAAETPPDLAALATAAGLSPFHFHRVFKAHTGLTPKAYVRAERTRRVQDSLAAGGSVTEAIYDAGFNSSSRFYEASGAMLGMTPSAFRTGGPQTELRFAVGETSLGSILVASSEIGVCAILLGDEPEALVRDLQDRFPKARLVGGDRDYEETVARVVGLVEAPGLGLELPLDIRGTAFQQRVWQALRAIPAGSTVSYRELAERIGAPRSFRAVAGACGANPLAVAIPCHRVVRNDGGLSGYRWGVERKRTLLQREASA